MHLLFHFCRNLFVIKLCRNLEANKNGKLKFSKKLSHLLNQYKPPLSPNFLNIWVGRYTPFKAAL